MERELHFFATSHGKRLCDGIGETIKRLARRASLQNEKNVFRVQTPIVLFSLSNDYINNITSFFSGGISQNDISHTDV
jgi:hypothetical protein